jgi:hypothetical protein
LSLGVLVLLLNVMVHSLFCPLPLFASAANLAIYDASAVSALGPKFRETCSCIEAAPLAAWLFASSKTLSVSACASSTASSIPKSKCCGADAVGADAAGDDDDDAAAAAAAAAGAAFQKNAGANERGRPAVGISFCAGGCPRVGGRAECVRGGPCGDGCGTIGGLANACPWCGPG